MNGAFWTIQDGAGSSTDVKPGTVVTISGDDSGKVHVKNEQGTFKISLDDSVATLNSGMVYAGDFGDAGDIDDMPF